jgi:hypothetical protein
MQPVATVNFGSGINASGNAFPRLSLSAYRVRLDAIGLDTSRKSSAQGIRVNFSVTAVGAGGSADEMGLSTDRLITLPVGADFSESSNEGRGNRAKVAELKSLLVALGETREVVNGLSGTIPVDFSKYVGRDFVIFNEPAVPGDEKGHPVIHWISPDRADKMLAGADRPNLKNTAAKAKAAGSGIPTGQTTVTQGLPAGATPIGSAPGLGGVMQPAGLNGGGSFPTAGPAGIGGNVAFGGLGN